MIIIAAHDVRKELVGPEGTLLILDQVELNVASGQTIAIIGESGSGKSTLLGLLAGLDEPTSGHIDLAGINLNELDEDGRAALRAGRVGFIFQSFHLLPSLTALENVMLPLELAGVKNPQATAQEALTRVGLQHRLRHYPRQLSGGEQQRVAIARAFAPQPSLLFADEPTGNLDLKSGARIADLMFALNAEHGATLILVTHSQELARRCDRCLTLRAGQLQETRCVS